MAASTNTGSTQGLAHFCVHGQVFYLVVATPDPVLHSDVEQGGGSAEHLGSGWVHGEVVVDTWKASVCTSHE